MIGSAIVAALVGNLGFVWTTITGLFAFGYVPEGVLTGPRAATLFPLIVGAIAFAGPSGMQQMWYTLWLRDKGAGMGTYIPRIKGLTHLDEEETIPSRGFMFDTEDPENMRRWKGWRRWVHFDAWVLFWGITMLTTIIYTVLAQSAVQIDPGVRDAILADDQGATLNGMSGLRRGGRGVHGRPVLRLHSRHRLEDDLRHLRRLLPRPGGHDVLLHPAHAALRVQQALLRVPVVRDPVRDRHAVRHGRGGRPAAILDILSVLSTFAMGAYCLLLLGTNNLLLPKKIRPNIITNILLLFAAFFYLGALAYSYFAFEVII